MGIVRSSRCTGAKSTNATLSLGRVAIAALALTPLTAACGGSEGDPHPATVTFDGGGASITVSMKDDYFEPSRIAVPVNSPVRVTVVNEGINVHNMLVAGPDGNTAFRSDVRVSAGESSTFEVTFTTAGTFDFSCGFHLPGMEGEVIVE
jgi:plastocyanin